MKLRESSMPERDMWESFFDPDAVLNTLRLDETVWDAVDYGCGYGTFSLAAARRIRGVLHGFDVDADMVAECRRRAVAEGAHNARFYRKDLAVDGTGLPDKSVDYIMLFNILHGEEPLNMLREVRRILRPKGRLAVIHWNYDPTTPRGPSMQIRPRPEQCAAWAEEAGLAREVADRVSLPPYHYGWLFREPG